MRILGLDPGEKRIGVAMSDPLGITAQALQVITRTGLEKDIALIGDICRSYGVELIVMGLPRNMDGTEGEKAKAARRLAEKLQESLGVRVVLWDERLSTRAAEQTLLEADMSRRRRKQVVDKIAAAYILQGYLDSLP
ncbi:MAG: Holliday junction resolvase RuvX [Syntrophomonadaceae bacterium]|jgi:putative Holliday junction resolvase|nr:Holliday junction resolvase RuvX [Syntrophomonadaceae bacterium]